MADASLFTLEMPAADIAVLSINDPHKGANVLSRAALAEFDRQLAKLEARTDLAGLVIRSTKPGNFIAGADLREFAADLERPPAEVAAVSRLGQELFGRLARAPFVTVAAIEGVCLGGGSELAIWCDRRLMVADDQTSFGFPEVKLGLLPGWGGTARTPRIVGLSNAVELITSGEPIDARAAYGMGLADVVEARAAD
ncbi:MAG TPA: enoyl-CoA hydratase-related protein, partial [Lacipirellulaceae bacterium]|nr:enoyl-CoA hydratase-related protein [Lacipirellulaceae bacterium]